MDLILLYFLEIVEILKTLYMTWVVDVLQYLSNDVVTYCMLQLKNCSRNEIFYVVEKSYCTIAFK